jgi:tetratricopeptide (TPR) repeat protein
MPIASAVFSKSNIIFDKYPSTSQAHIMDEIQAENLLKQLETVDEGTLREKMDPSDLGLALDLCFVRGNKQVVADMIDKVINVYPLDGRILRVKALLLAKEGKSQDAIYLLSMVPSRDPYFLSCVELIGVVFANEYQFNKAIETFSSLLTQEMEEGSRAFVVYQRAVCYQYQSDFNAAFEDCKEACELFFYDPNFFKEALVNFRLLCINGDYVQREEARKSMDDLVHFSKGVTEEYYAFGAYWLLMEWSMYARQPELALSYVQDYEGAEQADEFRELQERFLVLNTFLQCYQEYLSLKACIQSVQKPTGPLTSRKPGEGVKGMSRYESEMEGYFRKIAPWKEDFERLNSQLNEQFESEFNFYEAFTF